MRIAVVDDDDTTTEFIQAIMRRQGHQCAAFRDASTLITQLQRDTYDLIILDWTMPKISGMEALAWIRANLAVPPAVVMLTSRSDKDDIAGALIAGADDFIVKPEAAHVIVARVEAVLRRSAPAATPARFLDYGRYRFDRLAETVSFDESKVDLTAKEFALAMLFFQNEQRALSRAYILETLWNSAPDLPTRTLDMHVSRIRSKLQLNPTHGYRLFTIFSYGYRLERDLGDA